jgi:triosephosphate isomerase
MDKRIYIANWKSHKTKDEVTAFFETLKENKSEMDLNDKEIIVAPPFTFLFKSRYLIDKYGLFIKLSAQNVSPFPEGAYTGEINAKQIKEVCEYVIIGHSERRKYFHESQTDIENKVRESLEADLNIVQCVQSENDMVIKGVKIVAYEPPSAIGTGNPDSPDHIKQVFEKILEENPDVKVLYGGSVDPSNIGDFTKIDNLSGFLIGGASLSADSFLSLLNG